MARETELPGVGTKHTLDLSSGDELVVVEHRSGHFEIARVDTEGTTSTLIQLPSREAAELGRILSRGEPRSTRRSPPAASGADRSRPYGSACRVNQGRGLNG